ncbi:MAG: IS3 family transposase, partial [Chloroflexi bacterium]|nr:IS3 family transposase [Chloroflexota bacterium]MCX6006863.1 IS3 family transposase [Chloroflexota bacterium]
TPAEVYAGAVENTCTNVVESLITNTVGMAGLSLRKAPILSY